MQTPDTVQVETALAQHIADTLGLRYDTDGAYSRLDSLPAVHHQKSPDVPYPTITIATYDDLRVRDDHNPDYLVQVRTRVKGNDPRPCNQLADDIFHVLHGAYRETWGVQELYVLSCRREIRAALTDDDTGDYTRADSYKITVNPS